MKGDSTNCPRPLPARCAGRATLAALLLLAAVAPSIAEPRHGIAMHGEPELPAGFTHLPYVDPDAAKGGRITFGAPGTFDTLNMFNIKGTAALGIRSYVIESLLARSYGEPFSLYGLLAETVEVPDDRSWVEFRLRPEARFSDGEPVKPEDVVFSWEVLREHGRPNHRSAYGKIARAEIRDDRTVRFVFADSSDREMPLIVGLMPILAKHAVDPEKFEQTTLTAPIGSGPYVVAEVRPGERITYRRNPGYWGAKLPINQGLYNFDEVRFDYYRDANTMFEAFKKGLIDVRAEADPTRWARGYDFPAAKAGDVVRENIASGLPAGMNAFVFNTRRRIFADIRVREAVATLFDFEWANRNLYFDLYARTGSYFEGSDLSARGVAADKFERDLLAPFPGAVRADIMEGVWRAPATDGSGRDRLQLRRALDLLADAGWQLIDGTLRRRGSGEAFRFEILVKTREQERLALTFGRWLKRAGITADVRFPEALEFDRRAATFDFDMMPYFWFASPSPGNEQRAYWGSAAARENGSRNYMGVTSPAADAAIVALLNARERDEFVSAVRALDRVLLSGFYVVPLFHPGDQWIARRKEFRHPEANSLWGFLPETWWRADGSR